MLGTAPSGSVPAMKVALVQESPVVGDLSGNIARLLAALHRALEQGAELAITSELAVSAYPPRDYLDRAEFIGQQLDALDELAASAPLPCIVGFVDRRAHGDQLHLYNAA